MTALTTSLNLNTGWSYLFADIPQHDIQGIETDSALWIPLGELSDWLITSSVEFGRDWFLHTLDFAPDDQRRYVLHIARVPDEVEVYLNRRLIAQIHSGGAFSADITKQLRPQGNELILKLTCSPCHRGGGRFGDISINAITNSPAHAYGTY